MRDKEVRIATLDHRGADRGVFSQIAGLDGQVADQRRIHQVYRRVQYPQPGNVVRNPDRQTVERVVHTRIGIRT